MKNYLIFLLYLAVSLALFFAFWKGSEQVYFIPQCREVCVDKQLQFQGVYKTTGSRYSLPIPPDGCNCQTDDGVVQKIEHIFFPGWNPIAKISALIITLCLVIAPMWLYIRRTAR